MPNTNTTPASVASRLTDEEILKNASRVDELSYDGEIGSFGGFSCGDNSPNTEDVAAVLRDYVRLRRLENAIKAKVSDCRSCDTYNYTEYCREAIEDIERLLAEAEKGEAK